MKQNTFVCNSEAEKVCTVDYFASMISQQPNDMHFPGTTKFGKAEAPYLSEICVETRWHRYNSVFPNDLNCLSRLPPLLCVSAYKAS